MKWGVSVTGVRSVVKAGGVKTSKKIGRAGEEAGRIAIADGRQKKARCAEKALRETRQPPRKCYRIDAERGRGYCALFIDARTLTQNIGFICTQINRYRLLI